MLKNTMIDRKQKPHGYVSLPEAVVLRTAKVNDSGTHYKNCKVKYFSSDNKVQINYKDVRRPVQPRTPISEKENSQSHGLCYNTLQRKGYH